jgi:hypothetical protein
MFDGKMVQVDEGLCHERNVMKATQPRPGKARELVARNLGDAAEDHPPPARLAASGGEREGERDGGKSVSLSQLVEPAAHFLTRAKWRRERN